MSIPHFWCTSRPVNLRKRTTQWFPRFTFYVSFLLVRGYLVFWQKEKIHWKDGKGNFRVRLFSAPPRALSLQNCPLVGFPERSFSVFHRDQATFHAVQSCAVLYPVSEIATSQIQHIESRENKTTTTKQKYTHAQKENKKTSQNLTEICSLF